MEKLRPEDSGVELNSYALLESIASVVCRCDPQGRFFAENPEWEAYIGQKWPQPGGFGWLEVIHANDRAKTLNALNIGTSLKAQYKVDTRLWHDKSQSFRYVSWHAIPVFDLEGKIDDWNGAIVDNNENIQQIDRLVQLVEIRDEILGFVVHELKTPIATMFGLSDVLEKNWGTMDSDDVKGSLSDIKVYAERMNRDLDNLLFLVQTNADEGDELEIEPQIANKLIESAVKVFKESSDRRFQLQLEPGPNIVLCNKVFFEIILRNLFSNADKYSEKDKQIRVSADMSDEEVIISESDEGEGIDEEHLEKVFGQFFRTDSAVLKAPGLGIGLTVFKRLVEAQGGRIWVKSIKGQGTTFSFALPRGDIDFVEDI